MFGRLSAIEGASADERGGRIALVDREGSNMAAIALYASYIEFYSSLSERLELSRRRESEGGESLFTSAEAHSNPALTLLGEYIKLHTNRFNLSLIPHYA